MGNTKRGKRYLVLFLVFSGGTSYAINPFEEIKAVSQDPYSAHLLYLGMPEKEYEERFKSELWTKKTFLIIKAEL